MKNDNWIIGAACMLARHGGFWFAMKYFPTGSILDAKPKGGISYTWSSILKGFIWRVENGEIQLTIGKIHGFLKETRGESSLQRELQLFQKVSNLVNLTTKDCVRHLLGSGSKHFFRLRKI